jgi:hypothetical protein
VGNQLTRCQGLNKQKKTESFIHGMDFLGSAKDMYASSCAVCLGPGNEAHAAHPCHHMHPTPSAFGEKEFDECGAKGCTQDGLHARRV